MSAQVAVRGLETGLLHSSDLVQLRLRRKEIDRLRTSRVFFFPGRRRAKKPIPNFGVPAGLLTGIVPVLLQPPLIRNHGQLMRLTLGQKFRPGAQIGPSSLQLGERFRMPDFRLCGIAGLKANLLLALADELAQVVRDDFSELIDSGFRMLPRT
nr:hypothetical protein [Bradyrhizobium sp. 151]